MPACSQTNDAQTRCLLSIDSELFTHAFSFMQLHEQLCWACDSGLRNVSTGQTPHLLPAQGAPGSDQFPTLPPSRSRAFCSLFHQGEIELLGRVTALARGTHCPGRDTGAQRPGFLQSWRPAGKPKQGVSDFLSTTYYNSLTGWNRVNNQPYFLLAQCHINFILIPSLLSW